MSNNAGAGNPKPAAREDAGASLGPNNEIGRKLRQYYDELVSEAVPDRFEELLKQLEQAEPARNKDAV